MKRQRSIEEIREQVQEAKAKEKGTAAFVLTVEEAADVLEAVWAEVVD